MDKGLIYIHHHMRKLTLFHNFTLAIIIWYATSSSGIIMLEWNNYGLVPEATWSYSGFRLSVESNPELLWFYSTTPCDWLKNMRHLLNQTHAKL